MYKLTKEKERIVNDHFRKVLEAYAKMEEAVNRAVKDSEESGAGDVSVLKLFKAAVELKWERSLKMDSKERLEFAKKEFDARQDAFNEIKNILRTGRDSLLNDLDEQIEISRRAMVEIEEQLKTEEDDSKREGLIRTKDEHID